MLFSLTTSLTTYVGVDVQTVYTVRTSESPVSVDVGESKVLYAVTEHGDASYTIEDGTITLYGENHSFFIFKVGRPPATQGEVSEHTIYSHGLNITLHRMYFSENVEVENIYPDAEIRDGWVQWGDSPIYSVRYRIRPAPEDRYPLWVPVIALVILAAIVVLKLLPRNVKKDADLKFTARISALPEIERNVLALVRGNEGIRQGELGASLGLGKSHLSKLLGRMEARFLIRRVKAGRRVRVYLGEIFEK